MVTDLFTKELTDGAKVVVRISTITWPENTYDIVVLKMVKDGYRKPYAIKEIHNAENLDKAIEIYNNL